MLTGVRKGGASLGCLLDQAEETIEAFFAGPREAEGEFVTWHEMVRLAAEYGVCRVVKRPLSVLGLSMPIGSQRAILIKEGEVAERQRFTLAHEIAHLFLNEETTRQVWLRTPRGANAQAHRTLESFCDNLAARILMPKSWLYEDLKDKSPVPGLLLQLADKYGVSGQAFCIRAIGFLHGAYHVAEWRREGRSASESKFRRSWRTAARGMSNLMPETQNVQSPVGLLFGKCVTDGTASYSGELLRESKKETVEMRACLIQKGPSPSILTVTRRAQPRREPPPVEGSPNYTALCPT